MTFDRLFENALAQYCPASNVIHPAAGDRDTALRDWCEDYGNRWSWAAGTTDLLEACGPASNWCGAPTAVPGATVRTAAIMTKPSGPQALLVVTGGTVHTTKRTFPGSHRNSPTMRTLIVAGLLDEHMTGPAPFTALCTSLLLPRAGKAWAAVPGHRTAGLSLGRTGERRVDIIPAIEDFTVYSAAPLDPVDWSALRAALDGWTGHLRLQAPSGAGSGLFMAWDWHGDDPSSWSARADHTLHVLQAVRDALLSPSRN